MNVGMAEINGWHQQQQSQFNPYANAEPMFIPLGAPLGARGLPHAPPPGLMTAPTQRQPQPLVLGSAVALPAFNRYPMADGGPTLSEQSLHAHEVSTLSAHIQTLAEQVQKLQETLAPGAGSGGSTGTGDQSGSGTKRSPNTDSPSGEGSTPDCPPPSSHDTEEKMNEHDHLEKFHAEVSRLRWEIGRAAATSMNQN